MHTLGNRRWNAYQILIGVVVGSLLTGLAVPLADDDQVVTTATGAPGDSPGVTLPGSGSTVPGQDPDLADGSLEPGSTNSSGATGSGGGAPGTQTGDGTDPATGGTGGSSAAPGSGGGEGGQALTATDQGVTADTIVLGFALLDVGSVGQFGIGVAGVDVAQQRRAAEAFLADLNERGGINGRTVKGVYASFDVVDQADHPVACRELVQDQGAFAVIAAGGYEPNGTLCVTQQFGRPIINSSTTNPDELYRDAGGLLTTIFPRGGRMFSNVAVEMNKVDLVNGKRIGLVFDTRGDPTGSTMTTLENVLESMGGDVVHKAHLAGGTSESSSQVPVHVQQMQQKQVQVVVLAAATLAASNFVNQSDAQLFQPEWVAADWHTLYSDTSTQNMSQGFDGAYGFSTTRQGEWRTPPYDVPNENIVRCEKIYEDATGEDITWGQNDHALTMATCDQVTIFELAAKAAGPELTAASFAAGVQAAGPIGTTIYGGGAFGPGKTDLNDRFRTMRWSFGCRCFNPTSGFTQGEF